MNNEFNYLDSGSPIINNNFQYLQTNATIINNDFKYLTSEFSQLTPLAQEDFHIYIDSIELGNTDLDLTSISIRHIVDAQSEAKFK